MQLPNDLCYSVVEMASAKSPRDWQTIALVFIIVIFVDPNIRDYVARQWNKKAVALQIERLKSQVNLPQLTEADVRSLAEAKLSSLERTTYRQDPPFYVSRAQAWEVTYAPQSIRDPHKRIKIWVDDTTRYVSRHD
jgi:hypothetical protein